MLIGSALLLARSCPIHSRRPFRKVSTDISGFIKLHHRLARRTATTGSHGSSWATDDIDPTQPSQAAPTL